MHMRRTVKNPGMQFVYPTSVITVRVDGRQNGMTAAWTFPVSMMPLIYATSVGHSRYTHGLMEKAPSFGINLLADDQVDISNLFGTRSGKEVDKLADRKVKVYEATGIDCPMLVGCAANIECKKIAGHSHGDHTIFIGEALRCEVDEEKRPLLYCRTKYYRQGALIKGLK
jgi:flavin reductase (DIM6/NTAB) family NADH-FMN oxidoreductase RutF